MRAYELFIKANSNFIEKNKYYELALNALYSDETSNEELALILSRNDIQSYFGLSIVPKIINKLIKQNLLLKLNDSVYQYILSTAVRTDIRPIELIIELLISDNGAARIIGRNLIDSFKISPAEIDITTLTENQQIKLSISLTQDWVSGEIRVPLLLQLLNSDYIKVREFFLTVMQQYSLNYYGLIVEHLKKVRFIKTKEFKSYKKYLKELEHRFELFHNCPELYSEYRFPDIYEEAKRHVSEYMQKSMDIYEQQKRSTVFDLFPIIALGRGGGWRKPDGTVQPLANISVSVAAPMLLSSQTPLEELLFRLYIEKDWNTTNEI